MRRVAESEEIHLAFGSGNTFVAAPHCCVRPAGLPSTSRGARKITIKICNCGGGGGQRLGMIEHAHLQLAPSVLFRTCGRASEQAKSGEIAPKQRAASFAPPNGQLSAFRPPPRVPLLRRPRQFIDQAARKVLRRRSKTGANWPARH